MNEKKYLIGRLSVLMEAFPAHDYEHARKSLDGMEVVVDVDELDESLQASLEAHDVLILSHEDALIYLNDESHAGIWFELNEEPSTDGEEPTNE